MVPDRLFIKGLGLCHNLARAGILALLPGLLTASMAKALGRDGMPTRSSVPPNGICTNYDGSGFSPGAVVPDPRTFIPEPDNFPAMITDDYKPSTSELAFYLIECYVSGIDFDIYNFFLDQVVTDGSNSCMQMVCNHVPEHEGPPATLGQSCFNIIFPPGFDRQSPQPYPILIAANGWGETNNLSFRGAPGLPNLVNRMHGVDGRGLVLAQWNCGGHGSLGLTYNMQRDVAEVIDLLASDFNCDRYRVAVQGGSRAGGVALELARNRHGFDHTVVGVFVRNPALSLGTLARTPVASCPAMTMAYNRLLGFEAERYSHDPPPLADPAPILWPVLETVDPDAANLLSPDGGDLDGFAGKFILMSTGAHDVFFRLDTFLGFSRRLSFAGVPHSAIIKLQSGHGPARAPEFDVVVGDFLEAMVAAGSGFDPSAFHPSVLRKGIGEQAMNYYRRRCLDNATDCSVYPVVRTGLPFVATFPHRLGRDVRDPGVQHEPGAVFLCGAPGTEWRVELRLNDSPEGDLLQEWSGQFEAPTPADPHAETAVIQWSYEGLPAMDTANCYTWKFFCNGEDVSHLTNLIRDGEPIPARTTVEEYQPWNEDYYLVPNCGFSPGVVDTRGTRLWDSYHIDLEMPPFLVELD